ncbi:MAG: hypothetical protein GXP29_14480 [Planctomycetes bacterium]|nr:hypothetical protein [Planctomycetota bacterium]
MVSSHSFWRTKRCGPTRNDSVEFFDAEFEGLASFGEFLQTLVHEVAIDRRNVVEQVVDRAA